MTPPGVPAYAQQNETHVTPVASLKQTSVRVGSTEQLQPSEQSAAVPPTVAAYAAHASIAAAAV